MRNKIESRILVSCLLTFCLLIAPITALAKKGERNFKAGMKYEQAQQWERAAQEFTLAVAADPSNLEYQLHFRRASFNASQAFMKQGRSLADQRDYVGAYNAYRHAYGYDPANELAVSEMERMLLLQGVKPGNGTNGTNGNTHTEPAAQEPLPTPRVEQMRVISYSGDLKSFIRSLAEQLNLNVVFDRQSFVQPRNTEINLKEVTTSQALDHIFLQEGLFFQKLSRRTILVADQTRRPQYQQLVLRTFYLSNSEPEKVKQLVGQAIPPSVGRPQTIVVADKDTNSLTVRDTAENVRLIGELIESIDKHRAEVVMDVDIYEVSNSNFLQFGNQVGGPGAFNIGGSPGFSLLTDNAVIGAGRGVNVAGIVGGIPTALAAALVIPPSVLHAFNSKNHTKLIASTQVHAFNGEESTARIGQRVPVQTAQAYPFGIQTGTPNPGTAFPSGGFPVINYEPTGLTLKFTPQVFPNHDVQVKMSIESKDVLGASTLTPTFTERTITGTARVQNNRTMMLASVATDVQANGRQGIAILGLIPVLGRLFTAPTKDNRRIDIVIAVTPRVLRAPAIMPRDLEMRQSGTLQSPTTGSLEALLREAEREDQLAAAQLAKQNAVAKQAAPANASPQVAPANATPVTTHSFAPATTTTATVPAAPNTTVARDTSTATAPVEELPSFVPAPKSLVSNAAATEVAAVNNGITTASQPATSVPKPIETSISPVTPRSRTAQILMGETTAMKAGETKQFAIELKSHVPLALAVVALKFDPKVVKVRSVTAGSLFGATKPSIIPSIDPNGLCLISVSGRAGSGALQGAGTMLLIEVEAVADGAPGFTFDKEAMNIVATDAGEMVLEVLPVTVVTKQ
ncbi:MAG TPA: secretin N-terminal domain-containing protein [Pyrinomonadaceae bacterium]|nr:secretin N-terminal domain-containing protein [Pyrinomonadaceae bacterium]